MIDFSTIKQRYPMRSVIDALHLDGYDRGKEFVARNPTRDDSTPGSFSINIETGVWKDFATGEGGNDCVSLWRYIRGCGTMSAAAHELEQSLAGKALTPVAPKADAIKYTIVMPAEGRESVRPRHPELGEPHVQHLYRGPVGFTKLGIVCRWNHPNGKTAEIRPYFQFRSDQGILSWRWSGPKGDSPRPLYGLEQLEQKPERIWIVEGEKVVDAVRSIAPDGLAVLSWYGGVEQADKAELRLLANRTVTIIPDRDAERSKSGELLPTSQQPSMRATNTIAQKLVALGCSVAIVDYVPGDSPHGWDLADAITEGWDWAAIEAMVRSQSRHLPKHKPKEKTPANFGKKEVYDFIPGIDFPDQLQTGDKIRLLDTWANVKFVLDCYGITCRSNLLTQDIEMIHEHTSRKVAIEEIVSMATKNTLKTGHLNDHIKVIGDAAAYHPVIEWIKSKPWDGASRIPRMFETISIGNTDQELAFRMFFRWAISAVALVTQERMDSNGATPAAQGVLVLVGGQGINKSRWVSSLAPAEFVRPNVMLHLRDKDSLIQSTSSWIVEWAEVSGSKSRSDAEALRAFVTGRSDTIRLPYARRAETRPRRTVYIGTENADDFLNDPEGERRWWSIRVNGLNAEHNVDRQQFWAEVYSLFKSGERWWMSPDELSQLNESNETHKAVDPIVELIEGAYRWEAPRCNWVNATTALTILGRRTISRLDIKSAIKAFRAFGVKERKRGNRAVEFELPPLL